ncbi:hypothetical protein P0Y35_15320 [Kiritimatiellaeota bacterium B1221]|nr:hypothetical protein [Kiritimatiellaeota bacterium B1221]
MIKIFFKTMLILLNVMTALILTRFTVSKFAAWPESVAGFVDMAKPLGIDPTFFRITTGFIIGFAVLFFLSNVLILIRMKNAQGGFIRWFTFNNLYALGAMTGALLAEFFLRSSVKWMLVYIALGVILVSILNLLTCRKRILATLPSSKVGQV